MTSHFPDLSERWPPGRPGYVIVVDQLRDRQPGQPPAVRVLAGGRGAVVVAGRRRIRDAPGRIGGFRFPVVVPTGPAGHWPASGSGRSLSRSC